MLAAMRRAEVRRLASGAARCQPPPGEKRQARQRPLAEDVLFEHDIIEEAARLTGALLQAPEVRYAATRCRFCRYGATPGAR